MDIITLEQRSKVMRQILSKETKPEMVVCRHLHALGALPQFANAFEKIILEMFLP